MRLRAEGEASEISPAISPDKISVDEIEQWDLKEGPPTPLLVGILYSRHCFVLLWATTIRKGGLQDNSFRCGLLSIYCVSLLKELISSA